MSGKPKLSIVTINRNHAAGLNRTIASLSMQTCQDFEWLFVDGASSDESVSIAKTFIRSGDICLSEPDRGIYHAMNKAIPLASGQYLLYLNSGDTLIQADAIKVILQTLAMPKHEGIDVLLCGFEVRGIKRLPKPLWLKWWSLPTSHQAMIYKRALLEKNSFEESFRFASDFEHFLRISKTRIRTYSLAYLLVHNEPYGSDESLPKVLREYQKALLLHNYPYWLTKLVYFLKTWCLRYALR